MRHLTLQLSRTNKVSHVTFSVVTSGRRNRRGGRGRKGNGRKRRRRRNRKRRNRKRRRPRQRRTFGL